MRKALSAAVLALFVVCSISLRAQNVEDTSAPPIEPDSGYSVPDGAPPTGQIHGFIPTDWTASMITVTDLQTQDGQNWFHNLSAAQSINEQTKFVCENPGVTTTSSNSGDFYFYDMPPGSYVVAACMQTPDGHWRSGASVIALNAGQNALVALGPANGPIRRAGVPFVPNYYVGLSAPVWFGPHFVWSWPAAGWHATVYYHMPVARIAPIWVRPAPFAIGVHIVVPPYSEVLHGGYTYAAFHNGAFVQTTARGGVVLPPAHTFHPVTPEVEARMHTETSVAAAQPRHEPAPVFGDEIRSSEARNNAVVSNAPRVDGARPATPSHASSHDVAHDAARPAPQPREGFRGAPPVVPRTDAKPAPQPKVESRPAPKQHQESRPAQHPSQNEAPKAHNEAQHGTPQADHTRASRRT